MFLKKQHKNQLWEEELMLSMNERQWLPLYTGDMIYCPPVVNVSIVSLWNSSFSLTHWGVCVCDCMCVFFVRWWSGGRSGTTSPPKDHWPTPAPTSGRWSGSKGSTLSPWLRQKRYKHKRFTGMWSVCVSVNSCCVWNTCNILYFCTIFATVLYITISIL